MEVVQSPLSHLMPDLPAEQRSVAIPGEVWHVKAKQTPSYTIPPQVRLKVPVEPVVPTVPTNTCNDYPTALPPSDFSRVRGCFKNYKPASGSALEAFQQYE